MPMRDHLIFGAMYAHFEEEKEKQIGEEKEKQIWRTKIDGTIKDISSLIKKILKTDLLQTYRREHTKFSNVNDLKKFLDISADQKYLIVRDQQLANYLIAEGTKGQRKISRIYFEYRNDNTLAVPAPRFFVPLNSQEPSNDDHFNISRYYRERIRNENKHREEKGLPLFNGGVLVTLQNEGFFIYPPADMAIPAFIEYVSRELGIEFTNNKKDIKPTKFRKESQKRKAQRNLVQASGSEEQENNLSNNESDIQSSAKRQKVTPELHGLPLQLSTTQTEAAVVPRPEDMKVEVPVVQPVVQDVPAPTKQRVRAALALQPSAEILPQAYAAPVPSPQVTRVPSPVDPVVSQPYDSRPQAMQDFSPVQLEKKPSSTEILGALAVFLQKSPMPRTSASPELATPIAAASPELATPIAAAPRQMQTSPIDMQLDVRAAMNAVAQRPMLLPHLLPQILGNPLRLPPIGLLPTLSVFKPVTVTPNAAQLSLAASLTTQNRAAPGSGNK